MNSVQLLGRVVRDPDIRYTQTQEPFCVARFVLAVDRRRKQEGEQTADFINCVAFRKNGEFAEKYLRQGLKIACTGSILTGAYTNRNDEKVYTTEVSVDHFEFAEPKSGQAATGADALPDSPGDGFMNIPDGIDGDLPFN